MNKKYFSYIVITILCLNLLPQTSNAFTLNETRDDVIYINELEKSHWANRYLIYARHLKFINKTGTMVDIAKKAEKDPYLIPEIMKRTRYERGKAIVKWERDNGYIAEEAEKNFQITPQIRRKMLAEIEEEEKRKNEKENQSWWKRSKAAVKVGSFTATLGISKWVAKDWKNAGKYASFAVLAFTTILEVAEAAWAWIEEAKKKEEEIELPPLINMPEIPKGHKKIDIYSL